MSWSGLSGDAVRLTPSAVESERFGLSVARVVVGADAAADPELAPAVRARLTEVVRDATEDLLIVRWPAHQVLFGATVAAAGRAIIPADVLTYWEVPAASLTAPGDSGTLTVGPLTAADGAALAALRQVVADSFAGYGNHYTADPLLDPELALTGYMDWAERSLAADPSNVVLLAAGDRPLGIATLQQDGDDLEILLAGIVGASQGRGLYGHLLAGVGAEAMRRRCSRVIISTQVHNVRVQRAWVRAGFKPYAAVTTVHAVRAGLLAARDHSS